MADPTWEEIVALASRHDCLAGGGGIQRCMQLADRVRTGFQMTGMWSGTAEERLTCLSFECRSWQHCGMVPDGDDLAYLSALYTCLKK